MFIRDDLAITLIEENFHECPWQATETIKKERTQWEVARLAKSLGCLTYEERFKVVKIPSLEKRRLRNGLVLTHKILYNEKDLEATQRFKFFGRPGLRRSSFRQFKKRDLHAGSFSTGTVCHEQAHRYHTSQQSKNLQNCTLINILNWYIQLFGSNMVFWGKFSLPGH